MIPKALSYCPPHSLFYSDMQHYEYRIMIHGKHYAIVVFTIHFFFIYSALFKLYFLVLPPNKRKKIQKDKSGHLGMDKNKLIK